MKVFKWLGILLVTVVVLVGIVVFIGLKNLNAIVEAAVEQVGTDVVGTTVALDSADVKLKDGRAALLGLTVANPAGFSNASFLSVGEVAVDIDPLSLTRDVIVIDEVVLSGIDLLAEQKDITKTNVQALLDQIDQGGSESSEQPEESAESSDPVRLAVKKFTFEKSSLSLVTEDWGDTTLELPEINLANIGSAEQGLTPEELVEAVTEPVLQQIKDQVKDQLEDYAKDKAVEKAKEKLEEKLEEELGDKLSDSEQETLNKLKSLF